MFIWSSMLKLGFSVKMLDTEFPISISNQKKKKHKKVLAKLGGLILFSWDNFHCGGSRAILQP